MSVEIYVQARMDSTRLPGKVLLKVLGRSLLSYQLERLRDVRRASAVVVLTTEESSDDAIEVLCKSENIPVFRGPCHDVLSRYYLAALKRGPDTIVRVTSDCPLIDPEVIDLVIEKYQQGRPAVDYVSNSLQRTFPRGLDVEVFSFQVLEKCWREGLRPEEREHVTPYCYRHRELFKLDCLIRSPSLAYYRWTVDTPEDFELIRRMLEALYPVSPKFRLAEMVALLENHPDWVELNSHIEQKKLSD